MWFFIIVIIVVAVYFIIKKRNNTMNHELLLQAEEGDQRAVSIISMANIDDATLQRLKKEAFQSMSASNPFAKYCLGKVLSEEGNSTRGTKLINDAYNTSNKEALRSIARAIAIENERDNDYADSFYGYLLNKNFFDESKVWLEKIAGEGNIDAMKTLARFHSEALNDSTYKVVNAFGYSDEREFNWMYKAAELGDPEAQCFIGKEYAYGFGHVKEDYEKAIEWLRKSANQGYTDASTAIDEFEERIRFEESLELR